MNSKIALWTFLALLLLVSSPNPGLFFSAYGETPDGQMKEWLERFRAVSHSLRARRS